MYPIALCSYIAWGKDRKIMNKRYCSVRDVSQYTSLPKTTLYEWAAQSRIPSIKIGRRVLFDLKDIDELMSNLKRAGSGIEETVDKYVDDLSHHDV
jgi:excisionase family DNA binding protein|tara:strand:- start:301 stop:588 length:288 start_codon:yes stop_codon:yes gene_type:complete